MLTFLTAELSFPVLIFTTGFFSSPSSERVLPLLVSASACPSTTSSTVPFGSVVRRGREREDGFSEQRQVGGDG